MVALANNYFGIVFKFLNIKWGPRFSFRSRITVSFGISLVVLILVPIIASVFPTSTSFWLILLGICISSCAMSILAGAVLGLCALYPPIYTGAFMVIFVQNILFVSKSFIKSGNGVAGIISIFLRIITKSVVPKNGKGKFKIFLVFISSY